ncbi:MAG TPA: endonuclease III [Verrucomicrobiae bacterium]|nr:endonuclease III [Verrucomicrobiae bacterium]
MSPKSANSTPTTTPKAKARPKPKRKAKRRRVNPALAWARRLARYRPRLLEDTLDALASIYGPQVWRRRLDPTSELILTILTQNSADTNAEKAFVALRAAYPSGLPDEIHEPGVGWGGDGLPPGAPPDWPAVEAAPLAELIDVIRPGGLAPTKAPRLQATLRRIREERGDHSLEFLGDMAPLAARDWLTTIPGIGKKTASVLLLFCFNHPLMPVDRHVERVAKRIGLVPAKALPDLATDQFNAMLAGFPERTYEAHVLLIHHGRAICQARSPKHDLCPIRDRCSFVDPKAP